MQAETLHDVRAQGHKLMAVCRHVTCRHQQTTDLDRLIQSVGPSQMLIPQRAEQHFTDKMRCPSCKRRGMNLFVDPAPPKPTKFASRPLRSEPNYRVMNCGLAPYSQFDMIATADNLMVAKSAFYAASHFYPKHRVTLMQGALLMGDSRQEMPQVMLPETFTQMREAEQNMATRIVPPLQTKVD